ncbi:hypothetical protein DFH06DRAFT_1320735 [Mycena polygramma]|nr:hypothetical protein DFH06DRAFT_1320735 [Mycena polygramma]
MSRVTIGVHFSWCSFLGNHEQIPINGNPATAGRKILAFFNLFRPQKLNVTVTNTKILSTRIKKIASNPEIGAELKRIYARWSIDTDLTGANSARKFADKVEECLWQATLLLAATGRPNRAPRLDFFLMHVLTAALCLPRLLAVLPDPVHKAQLLQGYACVSALFVLMCGRPRIDIPLLMSYPEVPHPPKHAVPSGRAALGDPSADGGTNPWLAMIQNALHHKDAHVLKVVRTLYYCGVRYGSTGRGEAIGGSVASLASL